MSDITEATMVTYTSAGEVELPATIDGIRAALPEELRAEFDTEVGKTPAGDELNHVLALWALRTQPGAMDELEAEFARLEAGDFSGCVPHVVDHGRDEAGAA